MLYKIEFYKKPEREFLESFLKMNDFEWMFVGEALLLKKEFTNTNDMMYILYVFKGYTSTPTDYDKTIFGE